MRGRRLPVHARAYDFADDLAQRRAVLQPERIGLAERLPDGGVSRGRALIGPDKHVLEQIDLVQFVDAENGLGVGAARNIGKRQRREIGLDERNVRRKPRDALVNIVERLKVRQLHHHEEGLLERVFDGGCRCQYLVEALLDELRNFKRMKGGFFDADADVPESAGCRWVGQQVVREHAREG